MQPDQSQLFESLRVYLNNTKRLQPVIGLDSIIECVAAGAANREPLYLCGVCECRCGKADIRNHIFGSQHRFNYIKTWHPHLVQKWQEEGDLSERAWPLMELAKMVEKQEGPGEAKVIEVGDAAYQKMATLSESDAATLTYFLRNERPERASSPPTTSLHPPEGSRRIVLLNHQRSSGEPREDDMATVEHDDHQMSHEVPEESGKNSGSLGDHTRTTPQIVEYRSETGCSSCFLCHCCRIRSNEDIVGHLTSSSHLLNSLTETHPEVLEVITADMRENCDFLGSLVKTLQQQEDAGDLKVVTVPEAFCRRLAVKSYHWCVKMLHTKWTHASFQEENVPLNAPKATETAVQGMRMKHSAKLPCKPKRRAKRKKTGSSADTVFTVSLPLREGALLLQRRTSFSTDSPPLSPESPSSGLELPHSPDPQTPDGTVDRVSGSFPGSYDGHASSETSRFQQDPCGDGSDADEFTPKKNLEITFFKEASDCSREDLYHSLFSDENYEERSDQETWREQWPNEDHLDVDLAEDWAPPFIQEEHSEPRVGAAGSQTHADMSCDAPHHHDLQHYQDPYDSGHFTSRPSGGAEDLYDPAAPYLDVSGTNSPTQSARNTGAQYGGVSSEPGVHLLHARLRMHTDHSSSVDLVHTAPQSPWTQAAAGPAGGADWGPAGFTSVTSGWTLTNTFLPPLSSCGYSRGGSM